MDQVIAHRGQFVLISSVFAFLNGMGTIPYAMSKAAVEQLGRGLRVELAAHGVSTTIAYFSLIETNMIKHGVDDDPVVDELLATLPRPLLKRLQPDTAATALADGLAHRSPRVMEPSRWKPLSALRGLIAPAHGFASGPRPADPGRPVQTRRAIPHRTVTTNHPNVPARTHDHIERQEMTTWKDTPNSQDQRRRRRVRLPRTRHRLRRSGGVPAPPDRGPRRLGPANHRRHRRAPPRDRLRQPRCRRDRLVGATHGRADGRRRDRLHPRPGPRKGRPVRVLARRRRRPDGRPPGTGTRAPHDPRRHRPTRRRRHRQDGHHRRDRLRQSGTHAQRPQELPVLSPHRRGQTRRVGLLQPTQGTHPGPRQDESRCRPASLSSKPSGTPG